MDPAGVSRGRSTGGDGPRREGPNVGPRDDPDGLVDGASTAAILPSWQACIRGRTVKPSRPGAERSPIPASPETLPHPARSEDLWEAFLSRDEPRPGAQARRAQRRGTRSRRHDDRGPAASSESRLAGHPPLARRGHVPPQPRPSGDHPEARRRDPGAGRAHGARPLPPAGAEPGPDAPLRALLLGPQLRLPSRVGAPIRPWRRPGGPSRTGWPGSSTWTWTGSSTASSTTP